MTPNKRELAEQILAKGGSLFLRFDPAQAKIPSHLYKDRDLVFQFGRNLMFPIPDLFVDVEGIGGTLKFGSRYVLCFVPWMAVIAMWDDDRRGQEFTKVGTTSLSEFKKKPALRLIQGGKR